MKTLLRITLILSVALATACATSRQAAEKEDTTKQNVERQLNQRNYRINVGYMIPRRGIGRAVSGPYSLSVNGEAIDSHLPYFGVVQSTPYGGGKALSFQDQIDQYSDEGWVKGKRTITLSTDNGEDTLTYTLTIYDNGQAVIRVKGNNRDEIAYRGVLNDISAPEE